MTIFNSPTPDSSDDTLAEFLKDVDDKFGNDVLALKKAKAESDRFIEQLKRETAGMREDLTKRATYEELMAKIEATRAPSRSDEQEPAEQNETASDTSVDVDALFAKFEEKQTLKQQKLEQTKNHEFVQKELTKIWGSNYVSKLEEKVAELDLSKDEVNRLAATTPKALLAMLNPTPQRRENYEPPASSISVKTTGASDWDKFEKLRKESPHIYWTPKVQNELHELAKKKQENLYK